VHFRFGVGAMILRWLEALLSNGRDGSKMAIRGVVTDNIAASSGKIVIEARAKALGGGAYRRALRDE
jgi:hypothetical protein